MKSIKPFIFLSITCLLLTQTNLMAKDKLVKIGVSSSLSGSGQNYGLDIKDAINFAFKKFPINNVKLIFEDDKCSAKDAVTVANKFINVDKVDYVIGLPCSGTALATAPLYEKAKIPVILTAASSPKISTAGEYIFRTTPSDIDAASMLAKHVAKKHKIFGIISTETDYAQDLKNAFIGHSKNLTIHNVDFLQDTTDFKTSLIKLTNKKIDGIFVNTQSEGNLAIITKQLKDLKLQIPIYGAYFPGSPAFINAAGELANGIEFVDTPSLDYLLTDKGKKILNEYYKEYPKIRSLESIFATTYEGYRVLSQVIQSDRPPLEFLNNNKFKGIFGEYNFDKNGDIEGISFMMKKIVNKTAMALKE